MTLEQLQSFTDDELELLWAIVNNIHPQIIEGVEIETTLFPCIKNKFLLHRVEGVSLLIKKEYRELYNKVRVKLGLPEKEYPEEETPIESRMPCSGSFVEGSSSEVTGSVQ